MDKWQCEHNNKPSGTVKYRGFLDQMRNYYSKEEPHYAVSWLVGWLVS